MLVIDGGVVTMVVVVAVPVMEVRCLFKPAVRHNGPDPSVGSVQTAVVVVVVAAVMVVSVIYAALPSRSAST